MFKWKRIVTICCLLVIGFSFLMVKRTQKRYSNDSDVIQTVDYNSRPTFSIIPSNTNTWNFKNISTGPIRYGKEKRSSISTFVLLPRPKTVNIIESATEHQPNVNLLHGDFLQPATYFDQNIEPDRTTVVTALLDIGRGEWTLYRRPFEQYLKFMTPLLHLKVNMVIFIDRKGAKFVRKVRTLNGLIGRTLIYETRLTEVPLWKRREKIKWIIDRELNGARWRPDWDRGMRDHPEAARPDYDLVVNSKAYFLYNVSVENPFHSETFVWLDAGYGHGNVHVFPANNIWRPRFPTRKVTLIKLTPDWDLLSGYSLQRLYRKNLSVVSGGMVAADGDTVRRFYALFVDLFDRLLEERKVDDDQTLMVLLVNTYPHLFHVVHGDWFDAFKLF